MCPGDTIWAIEAVTNTVFVHEGIRPTLPGSWINCGGGGLGWSGGGALGIKLASEYEAKLKGGKGKFVVQIVGDGTFLFSVPGSVYWIAKRYGIPVLTIVLNNKGESIFLFFFILVLLWDADRNSQVGMPLDGRSSSFIPMDLGPTQPTRRSTLSLTRRRTMLELQRLLREAMCLLRGWRRQMSWRGC